MTLSRFWKVSRFRYLGITAGVIFTAITATIVSAQTTRTWNGTVNFDWFNATNWLPNGVPAPNDIVNFTNGTIDLTAPVTISNQFYWSGGILSGTNAMTIASNAVMIINTTVSLLLENPLTNAGTVIWSNNAGSLTVPNNSAAGYFGLIANQPGALFDIQCDQSLYNNAGTTAYFYNSGALRKSAGTGTTSFEIPLVNSGSVTDLEGTLNFESGGMLTGAFNAASGATVNFYSGSFTNSAPVPISGAGTVQLDGANLYLLANTISNFPLMAGTVYPGPSFQGGTITNLTIAGATLGGTNTVTGTFNCSNGMIAGGPLTIAPTGVLNINGNNSLVLENPLTNAGIVNWTNTGTLVVPNNGANYFGLIENLSGASFDIECDESLYNDAGSTAYFYNSGTLRKSASTGSTSFQIPLFNPGSVTVLEGTLNFEGGGTLTGSFSAGGGTTIDFSEGNLTNSGPVSINGPGAIQLEGANLFLLTDTITNFPLTSGTVYLGPLFQGGTITNLTIAGATLAGTNTVTGTFNWDTGTISGGPMTIASDGIMNINATNAVILESPLTNFGMVIWTNSTGASGSLVVPNGAGIYFGLIANMAGGLFDIQCDESIYNDAGTTAFFENAGMLRKSALTGVTSFDLPLLNSGSVTDLEGTLSFGSGGTLAGTFTAAAPGTIELSGGNFTNSDPVEINGPGTIQLTANGDLWLLNNVISNLLLTAGTVNLGPAFEGGTITNLTIAGATLAGTNTVTGTFNWDTGTISGGPITIASNGVMNIDGTNALYLESPLTNFGTVAWTNSTGVFGGSLDVLNGAGSYFGLIENMAGGLFDMQCDESIFNNAGGPAYLYNSGTLQKSALTGTTGISIPVTNSGTISSLSGNIDFSDGLTPVGGTLLFGLSGPSDYGTMEISGAATLAGGVGVLWLNGFVPANGNSFMLLTYSSFTGVFTNFTSPPGALWITNYGPTSFTALVSSINQLAFTSEPVGGKLTNTILVPVVVQVEDPSSNAVPVSGVPIAMSLNSGSGIINGTLVQNTDSSGRATFGNLSFNVAGTKTLRAASSGLTSAISVPFQILPLIGLQLTNTGALIQLNGSNTFGPVTIYASTNLANPLAWTPIYTNAATNGSIQFLDSVATNYPARFYRFTGP